MRLARLFLLGIVVFGLVGACSGSHESRHDNTRIAAAPRYEAPRLNVPGLLKLTIEEVGQQVGPLRPVPLAFADPTLLPLIQKGEPLDSTTWFQYQGLNVVATYDYRTRQVKNFLLVGDNEDELMRRCQLQPAMAEYMILPIFQQRRPTELMGLRVLTLNAR
jgi:hypothetical protein